jgi:glycosyltransferase involved in cell wall biosynthesis
MRSHGTQRISSARVHLITQARDGGVLQHSWALAALLHGSRHNVVLHVARDHEALPSLGAALCSCISWSAPRGPRRARQGYVGARFVLVTAPHLLRLTRPGDVVHIQGNGWLPALMSLAFLLRRAGRAVVVTPHNSFVRRQRFAWQQRFGAAMLRRFVRGAHAVVVFNEADMATITQWGGRPVRSPLIHVVPKVTLEQVAVVRAVWRIRSDDHVVLVAGHLRRDKGLQKVIESAVRWPPSWRLVVVGEDKGAWNEASALAGRLGVRVTADLGYQPLQDFVAAIAAADVVLCPYEVASQSGIMDLATQVGIRTVAARVGGLREQADFAFDYGDDAGMTGALRLALAQPGSANRSPDVNQKEQRVLEAHRLAYASAVGQVRRGSFMSRSARWRFL